MLKFSKDLLVQCLEVKRDLHRARTSLMSGTTPHALGVITVLYRCSLRQAAKVKTTRASPESLLEGCGLANRVVGHAALSDSSSLCSMDGRTLSKVNSARRLDFPARPLF